MAFVLLEPLDRRDRALDAVERVRHLEEAEVVGGQGREEGHADVGR
jgi:hypothetical protein